MKKKIVSILTLAVMVISLFAGCGTEEKDTEQALSSSESEEGKIALTVWGAEEDLDMLTQITESFKSEHKSEADLDISVSAVPESDCKDTLLSDVLNSADVFTFVDDQLMTMVAAGVLEPVEDADAIKTNNNEGSVEASSVGDTLYAYPLTADNGYFMYYNKSFFADADVQTLDQMMSVAAANGKKITMDWSSGWYLYSFFGNTGLELGLNDDGRTNFCTWNSADGAIKGTDVAQAMLSIAANPGFLNGGDSVFQDGIKDGSVIAGVTGVWNANAVQEAWGDNYGAVKLPTYTCAGQQIQMASFKGYKMIGVNAYSKHKEWSQKLASYISNEDNQKLRFETRQQGPANIKAAESPEVQSSPAIQAVLDQAEYASLQRVGGTYWDPVQKFGEEMSKGNPSGKPLQELLDTMVEEVTASNAQ